MIKQLHLLVLSVLMIAFGTTASAQDVQFVFNDSLSYQQFGLKGLSSGSDVHDGDIIGDKTLTNGDVTITMTANTATSTPNRMWKSKPSELRLYGNAKLIIKAAKDITKITFAGKIYLNPSVGTMKDKEWTGAAKEIELAVTKTNNIDTITVTMGEPAPIEITDLYSVTFNSKEAIDTWTKEGGMAKYKDFATFDAGKACVALNQYQDNGTTYFISPAITLGESNNTVSFENTEFAFENDDAAAHTDLVIRTTDGAAWEKIEGVQFGNDWHEFISSGNLAVPAKYNGKEVQFAFECRFNQAPAGSAGYLYVKNFKVMGAKSATPEPQPTETIAENIAAFNALCVKDGADVTLKLVDAQVLYVNQYKDKKGNDKQEVFVRDATGSVMFYNIGLTVKDGDKMNGSIKGSAKDFYGTKELCANAQTDTAAITITEGEAVAMEKTIAEITETEVSNLVLVKDVKMIAKEEADNKGNMRTNYYLVDANGKELAYYNKFHIDGLDASLFIEKESHIFVGVITLNYGKLQLCPTKKAVPTSIDCIENVVLDANAPMYNVAGQKVNANYKGIVIQNGKKFFNK